jgi:hypothetical protein
MTAYFDAAHADINKAVERAVVLGESEEALRLLDERLKEIETKLVFDCTVAIEIYNLGDTFKKRLDDAVLKHGSESLPMNAPLREDETVEAACARLDKLAFDLHTLFHDVSLVTGPRGERIYSDTPTAAVQRFFTAGETRREERVAYERPAAELPALPDGNDEPTALAASARGPYAPNAKT